MNLPLEKLVDIRIRFARGQIWTYEIKNALMIGATLKIIFSLNNTQAAALTFLAFISFYIIGYIDLDIIKFFQKEQELGSSKYNPHLNKINKLIKKKPKVFKS